PRRPAMTARWSGRGRGAPRFTLGSNLLPVLDLGSNKESSAEGFCTFIAAPGSRPETPSHGCPLWALSRMHLGFSAFSFPSLRDLPVVAAAVRLGPRTRRGFWT